MVNCGELMKKPKKKAPKATVGDLLKAASSAMESLDVEGAYQSYHQAASQLQTEQTPVGMDKKQQLAVLVHVLEKMGECQKMFVFGENHEGNTDDCNFMRVLSLTSFC